MSMLEVGEGRDTIDIGAADFGARLVNRAPQNDKFKMMI